MVTQATEPGSLSGTRPGVVRRMYLADGSLLQLSHDGKSSSAVLYWYNKRTKPEKVERTAAKYESLIGAIRTVLDDAKVKIDAEEVVKYIAGTRWGDGWPS